MADKFFDITWEVATVEAGVPTTWVAEFGGGYIVLHASPTGAESMVYVPLAEHSDG